MDGTGKEKFVNQLFQDLFHTFFNSFREKFAKSIYHAFMDNTSISILEISVNIPQGSILNRSFHWLMIRKPSLSIQELKLKSRDDSSWIQERFFDLGYLKYDNSQGIFIQAGNHEMHPLDLQDCSQVPENYLNAVQDWVGGHQQRKDGTYGG